MALMLGGESCSASVPADQLEEIRDVARLGGGSALVLRRPDMIGEFVPADIHDLFAGRTGWLGDGKAGW